VIKNDENELKGVAFLGMLAAARHHLGDPVVAQVVSSLNREMRELIESDLFTKSGWFPVTWYREMLGCIKEAAGPNAVRESSRAAVIHDLQSGIYKLVSKILSPSWLLKNTPKVFNSYYRKGTCVVELSDTEKHTGTIRFGDCAGFNDSMWEDLAGGCFGVLEAAGAKNVQEAHRTGGQNGDESMVLVLRWEQ
jgi:hypothetical protein